MNRDDEKTTVSYRCYLKDQTDKESRNLYKVINQCQNFYDSKQFEGVNTTNMIRTQLNICQKMVNTKASNIVGTPRFFTFTTETTDFDCTKLERFDEYNRKKMNEDVEDYQVCLTGYITGTAIDYYRWDVDDTAYPGIFKGGLVREHISPLNFAVANPNETNIQKQKWVMFWQNQEIGAIRALVEGKNDAEIEEKQELIVPDDYEAHKQDYIKNPESMTYQQVLVFTRFFRVNGEVFFTCETKGVELFSHPHALNPRLNVAIAEELEKKYQKELNDQDNKDYFVDYDMDFSDVVMQTVNAKKLTESEYAKIKNKFSLYPFVKFTPLPLNNSFYGNSDITAVIPIQKGINFSISMNLKCLENAAYNKILVKSDALAGQQITNEPGQVLVDHSRGVNGWGIKFAESQPVPNQLLGQVSAMLDLVGKVYNFNDVMDGSITNQDVSGYALQLMMKQSKTTLEQQQKIFWKFCKDSAQIRLLFYKHFVDSAKYLYEESEVKTQKDIKAQQVLKEKAQNGELKLDISTEELEKPITNKRISIFNGSEIRDLEFDIDLNVDVMQGTVDSKIAEAQIWETLILNGGIQNLPADKLELFMEANPIVTPRSKAVLKEIVERQKQSELAQTQMALQKATMQLESLMQYVTQLKGQVDYLGNYNKNLTKEFSNKLNVANKINKEQASLIGGMKSQGEVKSNNSLGIEGGTIAPTTPVM